MKINNKKEAFHAMAMMRKMELAGEDSTKTGSALYCDMYDAAEAFFAENPCEEWDKFAQNTNF